MDNLAVAKRIIEITNSVLPYKATKSVRFGNVRIVFYREGEHEFRNIGHIDIIKAGESSFGGSLESNLTSEKSLLDTIKQILQTELTPR